MNKLTRMTCVFEELEATPVTGFEYNSEAEFDELCRKLLKDGAGRGEVYDRSAGNGDTEESDSDDEYEEVPLLPPPKDSPRDTDQIQSEANITPENKSKNAKHFFAGMLHYLKSLKGAKTGKESKGVFGLFKKKHRDEAGKTEGKPISKTVKPNTLTDKKDVQDAMLHRSPPEIPPHTRAKKWSQKFYWSNIKTSADGGHITFKDDSGHQNTKIGRATVKPMPHENVEQRNEGNDLKMQLEVDDEYEMLNEVPSIKSENHSALEIGDQRKAGVPGLQDECRQIIPDPDVVGDMYEDMSAIDNDYLEPKSPVVKTLEESDEKQHPEDHQQMADASTLTIKEVGEKLIELKLEKYTDVFEENLIDGGILKILSVDDFVNELGLKKPEALRLYKFATSGDIPR